jgi:p-cymene monooxygenase electron transfer component
MTRLWKSLFAKSEPMVGSIQPFGADVALKPNQTLLEAALSSGVAFPHTCTVGTCASCKCKLISGNVKPLVEFGYTLSKEEIEAGYILACQAVPLSSLVVRVEPAAADFPTPSKFNATIKAKKPLTADILAVTLQLDRPVCYAAGQFATLQVDGLAPRSYSFAGAPARAGRTDVSFFIRKTPGGAFTEALFADKLDALPITLEAPHGQFFLRPGDGPLICVAGGSGLAPIMSLLTDARKKNIRRPCTLLFGVRSQADLYMLDAIDAYRHDWLSDFTFIPVLNQEPSGSNWSGQRGFVADSLRDRLLELGGDAGNAQAYMCGPPPMIDAAITELHSGGVPLENVHYDKFTDSRPASVS